MDTMKLVIAFISTIAFIIGLIFITLADTKRMIHDRKRCMRFTVIGGIVSITGLCSLFVTVMMTI